MTGATGTVLGGARGYFAFSSGTPTTITSPANVVFNSGSQVSGVSFTTGTSNITIQTAGVYRIGYGMIYSSSNNALMVLRVNGVDLLSSNISLVADTSGEVIGDILAALNAGDVLTLGPSGTSVTLTTIGQAAFLCMVQIA